MAAHRYWRASNLTPYGGSTVELSEFWLLNGGTRVDAPATLTSSIAPVSGTLSSLRDNNTVTATSLARGTVLTWDFGGSPADVTDIRVGSTLSTAAFLATAVLSWSEDGVAWTTLSSFIGIAWPGVRGLTTSWPKGRWFQSVGGFLPNPVFSGDRRVVSGIAPSNRGALYGPRTVVTGKKQFEVTVPNNARTLNFVVGVCLGSYDVTNTVPGYTTGAWTWGTKTDAGGRFYNQSTALVNYGPNYDGGAVIGVVVDGTAGTLEFYLNGVSQGLTPAVLPVGGDFRAVIGKASGASQTLDPTVFSAGTDLLYPVVGATPWVEGAEAVTSSLVSTPQSNTIPPATPQPARYDRVVTPGTMRALANFFFDPNARGRIIGTVKRKGTPDNVPLARRVRLYRDVDGRFVAETWSNAAGDFVFENIEENVSYTTIAYDYEHNYRAIAADNLNLANGAVELMR